MRICCENKDLIFYPLVTLAAFVTVRLGLNVKWLVEELRIEAPQCMGSNPQFYELMAGTITFVIGFQYPVQSTAKAFFMRSLPAEKFPLKSKLRASKALLMSERVYKLFISFCTSLVLLLILKNGDFLHTYLSGYSEHPVYFKNYPCPNVPHYLDDFYVVKLTYHGYELLYSLAFHR